MAKLCCPADCKRRQDKQCWISPAPPQGRAGPQGLVLGSTTLVFKYHLVRSTLPLKIKGCADRLSFVCKSVESPHYLGQPALLQLESKD